MTTLVIHAPDRRVKKGAKSFEQVLQDGIGVGYAIFKDDVNRLPPGSKVILLRKDKNKKRAEGILDRPLVPTGRYTPQIIPIQRYDVHVKGLTGVPYESVKLNHHGVAVISSENY